MFGNLFYFWSSFAGISTKCQTPLVLRSWNHCPTVLVLNRGNFKQLSIVCLIFLDICLKFPRFKTKTVGQWFQLCNTKNVWQLVEFPKIQNQNRSAVVWTSQDSRPKPLSRCLNFPWLKTKTVGQVLELPKTKNLGQLFGLSHTKSVGQLLGLPKNLDQNRWAVFSTMQYQKCLAIGRISQNSKPKPFGSCLNFARLETKTIEPLFELPLTQDQNCRPGAWTSQDQISWAVVWTFPH